MPFRIRWAGAGDTAAVASLASQLYAEIKHELPEHVIAEAVQDVVASLHALALLGLDTQTDEPVALLTLSECVAIYTGGRFGVIQELYVLPGKRSLGAGRLLIDEAKKVGTARGWTRLEVTATAESILPESAAFYRRYGFDESGPRFKLPL